MSKRNVAWLLVTVGVGVLVWITGGLVWGLLAAAATVFASELFERARRKQRRALYRLPARLGPDPICAGFDRSVVKLHEA